ncbi:protein kinase family protein [Bacillus cereus group sp. BfR-BA-01347]|uniref:protein kinase family protein n=1 Tax=Bacillus cereus group sp. BfR-BA-01347 TaxID=2920310 RepID=UPI001F581D03|nr:protein kinase family protein [Bacillus cereus group sp. BfR-BA-01347]
MVISTEEKLADYIQDNLESYLEEYNCVLNKRILKFYTDIPTPLNELFAFFHDTFNNLLDFFNTKLHKGRHYNAKESLALYTLIADLQKIQDNLIDTSFNFEIDPYYSEIFRSFKAFLQTSGGTAIPLYIQRVNVQELNPIFTLKTGLKVERPTGVLTFPTEEIGVGSYATVYKFTDPLYNKEFAYKKAHTTLKTEEKVRFYREFEVMKDLKSPFILEVYAINKEQNYYIMEYADETLEEYIKRHPGLENVNEKLMFIRQICKAFQQIHSQDILHRDISPNNILIKHFDSTKLTKVADFGLVKIPESQLTRFPTDPKGSLNDPQLWYIGFKYYEMHHETYAFTRLIYYMFTGRIDDGVFNNPVFEEFFKKGTNFKTAQRYHNIKELETAFFNNVVPSLKELGI